MKTTIQACVACAALWTATAFGEMRLGGYVPVGQEQQFRVNIGGIFEFEGMVEETTRKFYDAVGRQESQRDAESYGTDDFDMDGFHGMIGVSWNRNWEVFRLQLDTAFLNPSTETTAARDYWLTVPGDVSYRGHSYDHMVIPSGSPFSMEAVGNVTELTLSVVPFAFDSDEWWLTVNPMLDVSLLGVLGTYHIEAGKPRGLREYQNPPETFVVGGDSKGFGGAALPQVGVGVNVLAGEPDGVQLEIDAHYLMMTYDGSTGFFTTASHRKKDLDLDHRNIRVRGAIQFPMGEVRMVAGLQAEFIDLEGTLESSATSREEIIARRERFDKEFAFKMHSVMLSVGFVF